MPEEDRPVLPLTSGPLVLVVDDEATHRDAVTRMVHTLGYQARSSAGGSAALRVLEAHPREVRLLLADLLMPGMDGGELSERARDLDPTLMVVLMSGPGNPEARELLSGYRDLPLLWKPVNLDELARMLKGLLGVPARAPATRHRTRRRSSEHHQV
jgi:CheY-like chemotaxis protein